MDVGLQCHKVVKKAWCGLRQPERAVVSRRPIVLPSMFKAFAGPHLEHCVQSWYPLLLRGWKMVRRFQCIFTRLFERIREIRH